MGKHVIKTFDDGSEFTLETFAKVLTISAVAATVGLWGWVRVGDWRAQRLIQRFYGPTEN